MPDLKHQYYNEYVHWATLFDADPVPIDDFWRDWFTYQRQVGMWKHDHALEQGQAFSWADLPDYQRPLEHKVPDWEGTEGWTQEQMDEYQAYLAFLDTAQGRNFPRPADIYDYFANWETWQQEMEDVIGFTAAQREHYQNYLHYASHYGDPNDWYPENITDFFENHDVAMEQLNEWQSAAAIDYQKYRDYMHQRKPGEYYYTTLDEFVANYESALEQMGLWEDLWGEDEARREEEERIRQAALAERYRPEVQYGPAFYQQMEALEGESVYYEDWMRRMFPELRQRFEATQPRPTGYPTPEEARRAAAQTERRWESWLGGQDLRQEFYGQTPRHRGERPEVFAPRMRQVSYG